MGERVPEASLTAAPPAAMQWTVGKGMTQDVEMLRQRNVAMRAAHDAAMTTHMAAREKFSEQVDGLGQTWKGITERWDAVRHELEATNDVELEQDLRLEQVTLALQTAKLSKQLTVVERLQSHYREAFNELSRKWDTDSALINQQIDSAQRAAEVTAKLISTPATVTRTHARLRTKLEERKAAYEHNTDDKDEEPAKLNNSATTVDGSVSPAEDRKSAKRAARKARKAVRNAAGAAVQAMNGTVDSPRVAAEDSTPSPATTDGEPSIEVAPETPPLQQPQQAATIKDAYREAASPTPALDFRSALLRTNPQTRTGPPFPGALSQSQLPAASNIGESARLRLRTVGLDLCWPAPITETTGSAGMQSAATDPDSPINKFGLAQVHKLMARFLDAKRSHDWPKADLLRAELRMAGIDLDPLESYVRHGEVVVTRQDSLQDRAAFERW